MKKTLLYFISIVIISAALVYPNYKYFNVSIASMKQTLPTENVDGGEIDTVAPTLPSFLESSIGVHTGQDMGIVGKLDPTIPNTKIEEYIEDSLNNDSLIYGVEISKEVIDNLKDTVGDVDKNAELEEIVTNNVIDPERAKEENVKVDIEVVDSLKQFANK